MSVPVPEPNKPSGMGCWKVGLIGCGGIAVLFIIAMLVMGYFVYKQMPDVQPMGLCMKNQQQIYQALERYKVRYGSYPDELSQLSPNFLSSNSILRCPLDKSQSAISYMYSKPAGNAPATTVILSCNRHNMMNKSFPLSLQKDGKVAPYQGVPVKQ